MRETRLSARWIGTSCVVLSLVVFARPAQATPVLLDMSGSTCVACWSDPTLPNVSITGQLLVESTTGRFWDPFYTDYYSPQPALLVVGVAGTVTIDGTSYPLSFVPADPVLADSSFGWAAPKGDGSWLAPSYSSEDVFGWPGYLVFAADGLESNARIINDHASNLFQWDDGQVPISFSAGGSTAPVTVPETSSSFTLLVIGFAAVVLSNRLRNRQAVQ